MDVATSAYDVDVVNPAAFAKEIRRLENFGGRIIYPFMTKKISTKAAVIIPTTIESVKDNLEYERARKV